MPSIEINRALEQQLYDYVQLIIEYTDVRYMRDLLNSFSKEIPDELSEAVRAIDTLDLPFISVKDRKTEQDPKICDVIDYYFACFNHGGSAAKQLAATRILALKKILEASVS